MSRKTIQQVLSENTPSLMALPGVVGTALGERTGQPCITVLVAQETPSLLEQIPDTEKIIGFRNVLVHGYDMIDDATVWSAIESNLPVLLEEVRALQNT